jgi:hypothetical protein
MSHITLKIIALKIRWLAVAALLAGCEAKIYRAETTLNPDGSINRAIYQPANETPAAAIDSSGWTGMTFAPRVKHEDWSSAISDLPTRAKDNDHPYLAAWGDFASVEQLPKTFLADAPEGLADGELKRHYTRTDLVLVVEHRWRETLTDVVSLDDMRRAQRELADLLIPLVERIFNKALEQEYDTSAFVAWMQNTARPLAFELSDVYFDLGARGEFSSADGMRAAMEPVLARYGISLRDAEGKPLEDKALGTAIAGHARGVLRKTIRSRDGEPLPEEVVTEVLQWIGLEEIPEGGEKSKRFTEAVERSLQEEFGSEEAFSAKMKPLVTRIFGLYGLFGSGNTRKFHYRMQMPGVIVDTSGDILAENITRWTFSDGDAYPFGYEMQCRSLVEQSELVSQLVEPGFAADRTRLFAYIELVRDNERLLKMMRQCAAAGSLSPLVRAHAAAPPGSDIAAEYDALLKLLKHAH